MIERQPKSKEEEIFNVARVIPPSDERRKYLDQVCASDSETRQAVEGLLEIYDRDESFLESPPPDLHRPASSDKSPAEVPGTMIGPYKILEVIGEGGMGNVYMAEQIEPVHRKVALKIIKSGMDSKSVIARFEAERQALALMEHPNIAKFFDAGVSESGDPYFVMELIMGRPIIEFCQQHKLDLKAKLELFTQVCNGVQHAHQKGIIHRDLKPSNVLVARYDDRPVAKVIDFGVAKAIGERLTDKTMFTRFGQLVGTLEYMSPEQAQLNQLDVDTRSDVYSLGAILYELLTGTPPFEKERLSSAALEEVLRMLREDEPDKPSTRLSKLSSVNLAADSAINRKLTRQDSSVPADLDWIVMKCLEKDRSRRYDTTNALVQDIQRYLNYEAVTAGPPTPAYRMQKFLRRNKVAVSVATIVGATLLIGIAVSSWLAVMASLAEGRANRAVTKLNGALADLAKEKRESDDQREKAETEQRRATDFLNYLFQTLKSPLSADSANARVIDVLRDAAANAESEFPNDPIAAAKILQSIAETFTFLKRGDDAIPAAVRAREIMTDVLGANHPDTWNAFHYVYWAHHESMQFERNRIRLTEEATQLHEMLQDEVEENNPIRVRISLALADAVSHGLPNFLGNLEQRSGTFGLHDELLESKPDLLVSQVMNVVLSWENDPTMVDQMIDVFDSVSDMYARQQKFAEALEVYDKLTDTLTNQQPPNLPRLLAARAQICDVHSRNGDHGIATKSSSDLLTQFESTFGPDDGLTIYRRARHALILARAGDATTAEDLITQAVGQATELFGSTPLYLKVLDRQADVLLACGEQNRAVEIIRNRIEQTPRITSWHEAANVLYGVSYRIPPQPRLKLVEPFVPQLERVQDQEQDLREWIHKFKEILADCYWKTGNLPKALPMVEESLATEEEMFGTDSVNALVLLEVLCIMNYELGRHAEAMRLAKVRATRIRNSFSDDPVLLRNALQRLSVYCFYAGQLEDSMAYSQQVVDLCHQNLELELGRQISMDEALDHFRETLDAKAGEYFNALAGLASALRATGQQDKALEISEKLVTFNLEIRNAHPNIPLVGSAFNTLGVIYYIRASTTGDLVSGEKAVQVLEHVVPDNRSEIDPKNPMNAQGLSQAFLLLKRYEDAAEILTVLVEIEEAAGRSVFGNVQERLGYCQLKLGKLEEARETLTKFLSRAPEDDRWLGRGRNELGAVLIELGDDVEGEKLLVQGANELWQKQDEFEPHTRRYLSEVLQRTIDYYIGKNEPENAEPWQAKLREFEPATSREPRP